MKAKLDNKHVTRSRFKKTSIGRNASITNKHKKRATKAYRSQGRPG